jgi:hypothetical protein
LAPSERQWRRLVRRVRPEADRRCGPQVAALSARPLPAAWWAWRPAQQGAARRDDPAVWSERPHSAVRRDAAAPSSCCRRVVVAAQRRAVLPELAWSWELVPWCRAPVACHPPARATASPSGMKAAAEEAGVALSAQPVASAPWVQRPVEAAVAASDAKVRPRVAAEAQPVASARQPGVAEEAAVSGAEARLPEVAAGPGAEVVQPREAAEAVRDGAAELRPAGVAEEPLDAEVLRPAECRASAVAGRPSSRREGHLLPWLAPRRAARSAPAKRRSRTALPSRQLWRAAGCEALS